MRSSLLSRWGGLTLLSLGSVALVAMGFGGGPDFGDPLPGLTADQRSRFENGKSDFTDVETPATGLGPVFNDVSCGSCHSVPAVGGGSTRLETRYGTITNGVFDPLARLGGSLIHSQGIGKYGTCDYVGELVPHEATIVTGRRSTPLFGLGLVDAVPDETFRLIAWEQRFDPDITGIVSVVTDLSTGRDAVGKFGWKAQNPTLHQFAGDAYLNEMGITTPQFLKEICPQGNCASLSCNPEPGMNDTDVAVQAAANFMTFLARPLKGRSRRPQSRASSSSWPPAAPIAIGRCSARARTRWQRLTT